MDMDGANSGGNPVSANSAETLPAFQPVPLGHPDVAAVRDAIINLTGIEPVITEAVVSFLNDGELETLHSHTRYYFAVCRTDIRGVALDTHGNEKKVDFSAGDVIAFNPVLETNAHHLRLSTGGSQAAITYVPYTLPLEATYPQPGKYTPATA